MTDRLTNRERVVWECLASGLTNAAIARQLYLSERTVEIHVQRVFDKLGLHTDGRTNRRVQAALRWQSERSDPVAVA